MEKKEDLKITPFKRSSYLTDPEGTAV